MKVKDIKVGDTLYKVYEIVDWGDEVQPKYTSKKVTVTKVNSSSIYVLDENKFKSRYPKTKYFPLKEASSNIIAKFSFLTDNPLQADKWNKLQQDNDLITKKIDNAIYKIKENAPLKVKQDLYEEISKWV